MRPEGRMADQMRPIKISRNYTKHAEGSVLIEFGDTKVLCNATVEEGVPRFLKGKVKVGLPLSMACYLAQPTHEINVKQPKGSKQAVQWKSNA